MSVELTDFGSETAPASDMMSTIGAIGGTGGGLGGRANASKIAAANGGGGDTEQAVDRALKWIAQHQMPDGGWSFDLAKCPSCMGKCSHSGNSQDRCGATAMALTLATRNESVTGVQRIPPFVLLNRPPLAAPA